MAPQTKKRTRNRKKSSARISEAASNDIDFESYVRRVDGHQSLLQERGQFSRRESLEALTGDNSELHQRVAEWLRGELANLREQQLQSGAVVRLGRALSRLEIADVALTLIESASGNVGDQMLCLLQELLDVDRHRVYLAEKNIPAREAAASIDARRAYHGQKKLGIRELAKMVSASPSSIVEWRKSLDYQKRVNVHKGACELAERFKK